MLVAMTNKSTFNSKSYADTAWIVSVLEVLRISSEEDSNR